MEEPECLKEFLRPKLLEEYKEPTYLFQCRANKAVKVYFDDGDEVTEEKYQDLGMQQWQKMIVRVL